MKTLTRTPAYWLLVVASLAAALLGGWLIAGQVGTMTTTLLAGTATGIEVYVGQSLVVVGAAALGAGIVGLLLALGLAAATSLVRSSSVTAAPIADGAPAEAAPAEELGTTAEPTVDETRTDDVTVDASTTVREPAPTDDDIAAREDTAASAVR